MYTVVTIQQQIIEILGIDEKYNLVNRILYTVVTIQQQIIEIQACKQNIIHCSNHTKSSKKLWGLF